MSAFLKHYGFINDNEIYKVNFSIPQNCKYSVSTEISGAHLITVTLEGKEPSPIFINQEVPLKTNLEGFLEFVFCLPDEAKSRTEKKPKVVIHGFNSPF